MPRRVRRQRPTTEQTEPQQRLESVADAQNRPSIGDETVQRLAERLQTVRPERAGAEMIAE